MKFIVDWSVGRRLPREKRAKRERESSLFPYLPKTPQEAEAMPAGKRPPGTEINGIHLILSC